MKSISPKRSLDRGVRKLKELLGSNDNFHNYKIKMRWSKPTVPNNPFYLVCFVLNRVLLAKVVLKVG